MAAIDWMISGLDNGILTAISLFIDHSLIFALLTVAIVLLTERRNEKRKKIFVALALAFIAASAVKEIYHIERPCSEQALKTACPGTYSFPSVHSAIAFTLMLSFINKPSYYFYLLFALFVSFTRIYLGVHTFEDIVGGIVVGAISYYAVDLGMRHDNR